MAGYVKTITLPSITGIDTPPPLTGVGTAYVIGSSPVKYWTGYAGQIAIESGLNDVPYNFISKTAMKDYNYMVGGTLYTYSGTAFVAAAQADTESSAIASVTSAADKVPYFTGAGTADVFTMGATARSAAANLSGTNTGDQDISDFALKALSASTKEDLMTTDETGITSSVAAPAAVDGNYKLRATWSGSGSTLTYAWVAE